MTKDSSAPRAVASTGPALAPRRANVRDPWLDNAKVLACVLVVFGHTWEPLQSGSESVKSAHLWLYAFHVPAFVLVSGYFSRAPLTAPRVRGLVQRLLLPYLVFELLYAIFRRVVTDTPFGLTLVDPWWLTWFLLCLFIWRLTAPVWGTLRHPVAISVVVSCAATLNTMPVELELGRLLQMLPFFVVGLRVRPQHLALLRRPAVRVAGALVLVGSLAVTMREGHRVSGLWTLYTSASRALHVGPLEGLVLHLALLATSLLLVASFLAVVPVSRRWFTPLAAGSLYAYLLHGFVVKGALAGGLFDVAFVRTGEGTVLVTVAAGVLAVLLMSRPVRALTRPLVEPRVPWLFAPSTDPAPSDRSERDSART